MKMNTLLIRGLLVLGFMSGTAYSAEVSGDSSAVSFATERSNIKHIVVAGQDGFLVKSDSLDLSFETPLEDGDYSYEITGKMTKKEIRKKMKKEKKKMNSLKNFTGRKAGKKRKANRFSVVDHGYFMIVNGAVETGKGQE